MPRTKLRQGAAESNLDSVVERSIRASHDGIQKKGARCRMGYQNRFREYSECDAGPTV